MKNEIERKKRQALKHLTFFYMVGRGSCGVKRIMKSTTPNEVGTFAPNE